MAPPTPKPLNPAHWREQLARGLHWLLHWLLPNHCYLCGEQSQSFLCYPCANDLTRNNSACRCCALPLQGLPADRADRLCGDCLAHPKPFVRTLAAFVYQHPLDFLINRFKHHRLFACGTFLCLHLARTVERHYRNADTPDALVPVPLHWRRRVKRGFNQSELLAGQLSQQLGVTVLRCCRRIRSNNRQQGLKRKERLSNLRSAFSVTGDVQGKHLVIVDDVMTTGATATEIARCLLAAGAARVDVWVLARVP